MLLGYSDAELANMGGYDLVHYDDLAYIASAHQECKFYRRKLLLSRQHNRDIITKLFFFLF